MKMMRVKLKLFRRLVVAISMSKLRSKSGKLRRNWAWMLLNALSFEGDEYSSTETSNSSCPISNSTLDTSMAAKSGCRGRNLLYWNPKNVSSKWPSSRDAPYCEVGTVRLVYIGKTRRFNLALISYSQMYSSRLKAKTEIDPIGEGYVVDNDQCRNRQVILGCNWRRNVTEG